MMLCSWRIDGQPMDPKAAATVMHLKKQGQDVDRGETNSRSQAWGTWEELVLACAVKRHGFRNWDSIAMEVRAKSSLPRLLTTAQSCRLKYCDLKRRFATGESEGGRGGEEAEGASEDNYKRDEEGEVDSLPWVEKLRSLRVDELRRELQRSDVSIMSLQLKVKTLKEEREREEGEKCPDLDDERKAKKLENDKGDLKRSEAEENTGEEEESDRENRSVNESNTTGSGGTPGVGGANPEQDHGAMEVHHTVRKSEVSQTGDLGTQGSGDVQSSASPGRKRKRRRDGGGRKEEKDGGDGMKVLAVESHPLVRILKAVRAQPHVSLFERRLRSQESDEYKSLIKQHLDLQTIQTRLDQGSYAASHFSFFRDLLLLINNAILFFPKSSPEVRAASRLRTIIHVHRANRSPPSSSDRLQSDSEAGTTESALAQRRGCTSLVLSRNPSSVLGKSSSNPASDRLEETKLTSYNPKLQAPDQAAPIEKEKPVTGARSSRKSRTRGNLSKPQREATVANCSREKGSKIFQNEGSVPDKKTVADFLRRIKKNSGDEEPEKYKGNTNGNKREKVSALRGQGEKKKAKVVSSPSKKITGEEEEEMPAKGKRGIERVEGKETKQHKRVKR